MVTASDDRQRPIENHPNGDTTAVTIIRLDLVVEVVVVVARDLVVVRLVRSLSSKHLHRFFSGGDRRRRSPGYAHD